MTDRDKSNNTDGPDGYPPISPFGARVLSNLLEDPDDEQAHIIAQVADAAHKWDEFRRQSGVEDFDGSMPRSLKLIEVYLQNLTARQFERLKADLGRRLRESKDAPLEEMVKKERDRT